MISESRKVTENMLTAHPDLDGIFCSNESGSEGAAQTLKARGSKIKLVGFDSSPMLEALLQEGWIDSLIIQDPFKMGETAVDEAEKALKREKTPKKIFLPPRVVNDANLNDPDVQAQLHPDLKRYLNSY
jgi:ribose transport system substrate-binding protein